MRGWRLVADVGGTNVRFARSFDHHRLSDRRAYLIKDFSSLYEALSKFLKETGSSDGCTGAAIGVAGAVDDNLVRLTNAPWTIDGGEVAAVVGGAPAKLVNDLQAVAFALPHLSGSELIPLGAVAQDPKQRRTMLALNVGTGFGGAVAIPVGNGWITNPGEPGHMALGALTADELEITQGASSVEDLLSGRGVEKIYERLAARARREAVSNLRGAEIFDKAGEDPVALETVHQFSALLGRIAGDLVLATAAWGGIFLCGSVVNGWFKAGGGKFYRAPFEDKGAMSARMKDVYSGIIARDDVALVGLTYLPLET